MDDPGPEDGDFVMPDHFKGIDLSDEMKADLDKLLAQFLECLSDKPGHTNLATHSIQTTTELPIWSPTVIQFLLMLKLSLNKSWTTC